MLLGSTGKIRFFIYSKPTDMRKSHNGLCGIVINAMQSTPTSGDVFIFINKRQTHIKLLYWDRTGFVIFYKRLESGTFELPESSATHVEIAQDALMMILEGISLTKVKKRKRFQIHPDLLPS